MKINAFDILMMGAPIGTAKPRFFPITPVHHEVYTAFEMVTKSLPCPIISEDNQSIDVRMMGSYHFGYFSLQDVNYLIISLPDYDFSNFIYTMTDDKIIRCIVISNSKKFLPSASLVISLMYSLYNSNLPKVRQ